MALLDHAAVSTAKFDETVRFFTEVFNMHSFRSDGEAPKRRMWMREGIQINECVKVENGENGCDHISIAVESVSAVMAAVTDYGCKIEKDHWFSMPEGLKIELKPLEEWHMDSIFSRVSVRSFEEKPVEDEKLIRILKAAMAAPSACNQQPWEFYVVNVPEAIEALAECSEYGACAKKAPVLIVSVYKTQGLRAPEYAQVDMAIAQQNMWLEADLQGLGGVWIGIAPNQERMEKVEKVLNLKDGQHAFSIFALGYPKEKREQQDRFDSERIHYIGV